ncbi:RNA polymerase sigma factor [Dialister sp.]|jgi:RNA polymerase sigma factor (sigma-70 family)|uniref:RNA polymerase sigma factor n=1 Tax=Dialister sp. TaxID=1955814 RepID=UPI003A5C5D13
MKNKIAYKEIERLVKMARTGDKESLTLLCHRFHRLIYKLSVTSYETIDREDMAQTLWVHFLEMVPLYLKERNFAFTPWISAILRRRAVDYVRQHEKELSHQGAKDSETHDRLLSGEIMLDGALQNWYVMEDQKLTAGEVEMLIHNAQLTERQETLLRLRMKGIPWAAMADYCHLSKKNVYKHKNAICEKLKRSEDFQKYFA